MDFSNARVLCVGDVMLDRFIYGEVERISPEAPVPIIRTTRTHEMLGGAGNVANNIASLGGRAVLIGLVGQDGAGACLRSLVAHTDGVEDRLATTPNRPTICKTRFVAGNHQVVRSDDESQLGLQPDEEEAIVSTTLGRMPHVDAVILSDYGKGVLSLSVIARSIESARRAGLPVFVDPKTDDFSRYTGATCITLNLTQSKE